MTADAQLPPDRSEPASGPNKHTAIGIGLNTLLLLMIAYGFWQSDRWRWAWALVALPIAIVTARYIRHWMLGNRGRP